MALQDRLVRTEHKSRFATWLDALNDTNRTIVLGWLHDRTISNIRLAEMIRDDDPDDDFTGYQAGKDTIAMWRRANVPR